MSPLRVALGRDLGSRVGEDRLGHVVQEARLGQGDKDIGLGPVAGVTTAGLVLGAGVDDLVVRRLRTRHVDLVGGHQDPAEQQLLQLHPQDVPVLLRRDRRGCHPTACWQREGTTAQQEGRRHHLDQDVAALVARGEDDGAVRPRVEPVEADGAIGHVEAGPKFICRDTVGR